MKNPETVLILRSCDKNLQSYEGFQWPREGPVEAPDWQPSSECGHGLHGFLWGEGNASLADASEDAVWLVVRVRESLIINLKGKVKFPSGNVVFSGPRADAVKFIQENGAAGKAVIYGTATAGDSGIATAGAHGTATAGRSGTATAGNFGTATAGNSGTAAAGNSGTATAGYKGTATAGYRGTLILRSWDEAAWCYRTHVAYVGEADILPGVAYKLKDGKFVKA